MDLTDTAGFDMVVLCAEELQPEPDQIVLPGVTVILAPNDDSGGPFTRDQQIIAWRAAHAVASAYKKKARILVSCFQGRNRSGLVMAMALHLLTGESGEHCMRLVRIKVPGAIGNLAFSEYLETIKKVGT
jgi:protein-tyrosine phosphatase